MIIKTQEYHGKPVLSIWESEDAPRPTIAFGRKKAECILSNFKAIIAFVESQEGDVPVEIYKLFDDDNLLEE